MARREEAVQLYDERFALMWEFYLAACEMAFRKQDMMNFQLQVTRAWCPDPRLHLARERPAAHLEDGARPRPKLAGE